MIVAGLFLQQLGRETEKQKLLTKYTTEKTGIGRKLASGGFSYSKISTEDHSRPLKLRCPTELPHRKEQIPLWIYEDG